MPDDWFREHSGSPTQNRYLLSTQRSSPPRPLAFVAVSAFAALCNFVTRVVLTRIVPYPAAIVGAFFVGLGTAFYLNRRFVFEAEDGSLVRQLVAFVAVNLVGLAQTMIVSLLLVDVVLPSLGIRRFAEEIAHAIGIASPIVTSYFGHAYITFRSGRRSDIDVRDVETLRDQA